MLTLSIDDDGPGIANASNLFVPFFTTKPQGSGIGLALARQIAEAHGGTLTLRNRHGRGAPARFLRLPVVTESPAASTEGRSRRLHAPRHESRRMAKATRLAAKVWSP